MKNGKFLTKGIGVTAITFGFILGIISCLAGVDHLFHYGITVKGLLFFLPISIMVGILAAIDRN